ncbi:MAG TPA: transposase [Gaiellaceae bacterium]
MARPLRALHEGIYHLAARGSDERHLFVVDSDREDFLDRLAATCERFELGLLSYVLMGSHYHALIRISDARFPVALQRLHTDYSRSHNRRHGHSAHLFRAHAMTLEITSDRQLIAACRYVALNPVTAGLVASPLDWPWSSARAHAGFEKPRIPLSESDLRAAFGDADDWRERFRGHIEVPDYEISAGPRRATTRSVLSGAGASA